MYEWLLDYQDLSESIEYLEYKLEREKRELKRWTCGDLFKVKLTEGSIASGLEERIEMMEYELAHKMNDLYDAERLIASFGGLDNKILYYRYVKGKSLEDIAFKLDYSYSHISKRHAEVMRAVRHISTYLSLI